jgi:hypothetical protein
MKESNRVYSDQHDSPKAEHNSIFTNQNKNKKNFRSRNRSYEAMRRYLVSGFLQLQVMQQGYIRRVFVGCYVQRIT